MRLVVSYQETDGFTFSCERTVPVEYVSIDDFLLDTRIALIEYLTKGGSDKFHGVELCDLHEIYDEQGTLPYDDCIKQHGVIHYMIDPTVQTVDDWFA